MKLLSNRVDAEIAGLVIQFLEDDDQGYPAEEAIPGLIQAVILLAEKTSRPEQALDEAANILADSGVV